MTKHNFYPPIKKETKINQFAIISVDISLFTNARIGVELYAEDGSIADRRYYLLDGIDYSQWSSDDSYIINFVKGKLQEDRSMAIASGIVNILKNRLATGNREQSSL